MFAVVVRVAVALNVTRVVVSLSMDKRPSERRHTFAHATKRAAFFANPARRARSASPYQRTALPVPATRVRAAEQHYACVAPVRQRALRVM